MKKIDKDLGLTGRKKWENVVATKLEKIGIREKKQEIILKIIHDGLPLLIVLVVGFIIGRKSN